MYKYNDKIAPILVYAQKAVIRPLMSIPSTIRTSCL